MDARLTYREICMVLDQPDIYDILPGNGEDDYILQRLRAAFKEAVKKHEGSTRMQRPREKKQRGSYFRKDHEYLETAIEKTRRRVEIFRNAGGEVTWFDESDPDTIEEIQPAMCQGCAEPHLIGWSNLEGNWHHNVKSKGGRRCDCAACALYVCIPWHRIYHNRVIAVRQVE